MTDKPILYGDGLHDDTEAIQYLIDHANHNLTLPVPEKKYMISKPLELPSDFCFQLPRFAEIKLVKGSNCVMLKNKTQDDYAARTDTPLFDYLDLYSPTAHCRNIEVTGGIWNFNNLEQRPNPLQKNGDFSGHYWGFGMLFYGVHGFRLANMTFKDPINFCVNMDTVTDFTVENITFDFNYGNPTAVNMDGIHINGNCHRGVVRNLKGACYDDMVALNADEGSDGPIRDVEICNLYALDSHSAVRLLTVRNPLENIHIHDVFGTYYQYCIGVTRYYPDKPGGGWYRGIRIDNIYASKAKRLPVYQKEGGYLYPLIWVDRDLQVYDLTIEDIHRTEENVAVSTVHVSKGSTVDKLIINRVFAENRLAEDFKTFSNLGTIKELTAQGLKEADMDNAGIIYSRA